MSEATVLVVEQPVPVWVPPASEVLLLPPAERGGGLLLVEAERHPQMFSSADHLDTLLICSGDQGPRGVPGAGLPEIYATDELPVPDDSVGVALWFRTGQYPGQPGLVDLYLGQRTP